MSETSRPTTAQRPRGRQFWRDRPGIIWLVAAVVVALIHRFVPDARWLMVHMVVLGAVTHNIMVWSMHFATTLLKVSGDPEAQNRRLAGLQLGALLVIVGVPTSWWWLVLVGACVIAAMVGWHALTMVGLLRRALPARFTVTVHHYLAAACWLGVGITLGVLLALRPGPQWRGRMLVAHTTANVFGWVGLTVIGTLLTLWPTILRTRMDDAAVSFSRWLLWPLNAAVALIVSGALFGSTPVTLTGLGIELGCLVACAVPLARTAVRRPPLTFSALSVAAAYLWLVTGQIVLTLSLVRHGTWARLGDHYGPITAILVAGFALQIVLGALTYLLPVVLGGGPRVMRAAMEPLEGHGVLRVALINGGLILWLAPTPSLVKVVGSLVALAAACAYLPRMMAGIKAGVRERRAMMAEGRGPGAPVAAKPPAEVVRPPFSWRQLGVAAVILAVLSGAAIAVDPQAAGLGSMSRAASGTGHTTTVKVRATAQMRFEPSRIEVPAGDRLVIELTNADPTNVHDLALESGGHSGRLAPGETATIDAGVATAEVKGWCTVIGHRQMGMGLTVVPTGAGAATSPTSAAGHDHGAMTTATGAAADLDHTRKPGPDWKPVDARLAPLGPERVHEVTLRAQEVDLEVAPGVRQRRWTFNGTVPGPVLHGRVGDRFKVTLINDGSMGHSIDFHAGEVAPDAPMRTIAPGESLVYEFTAARAGIWMYHCSTMPMSAHIAAGMHGAVVIEPDGLEPMPSYVLVQSEAYLGAQGAPVDAAKVTAGRPDAYTFNGVAWQYDHAPLTARVGERVRLWVLDAGPNRASSFHIVGAQFDTVWAEGAYTLRRGRDAFGQTGGGSQALGLQPAQGGFVETVFVEPGHYPFVSHIMSDAEAGAHGIVEVRR